MPTALPARPAPRSYRQGRPLTRWQAVRFYWLFARVVILDARLHAARRRVDGAVAIANVLRFAGR